MVDVLDAPIEEKSMQPIIAFFSRIATLVTSFGVKLATRRRLPIEGRARADVVERLKWSTS